MHENSINASLLDKPDLIEEEYEDLISKYVDDLEFEEILKMMEENRDD